MIDPFMSGLVVGFVLALVVAWVTVDRAFRGD